MATSAFFCTSRIMPEVIFAGARWAGFVTSHDLVQGDHLIFSLTAMSQFQVYVFDAFGNPKGLQKLQTPMKWSEVIKRPREGLAFDKSVNKMSGTAMCTRNRVTIDDGEFAGCPFNDPACQIYSFNNTFSKFNLHLKGGVSCLPSFSSRMVAINVYRLELPQRFVAAHGSQLHDPVQLQGIYDKSPAQNNVRCVCYRNQGRARIYLRWEDFVSKNKLCLGQELVFTLTADSCFTVREQISWSPRTGLNLCSHVPMSVRKSGAK